ncbi:MAG: carbonic anhydrase [Hyphomicrobiaceae bacterium]
MRNGRDGKNLNRRDIIAIAGLAAAVSASGAGLNPAQAADPSATTLSPDQALAALKAGNAKYVSNPQVCTLNLANRRAEVASHQAPWATIISCADSRVPPELLFGGLGIGELFVARNAGNLVDTATIGTAEYGAAVLGSPVIVVLGHGRCGAVAAACKVVTENATFPGSIGPMIEPIIPAAIAVRDKPGDFVENTIRQSAKRTAHRLTGASTMLAELVKSGKLKVVAAYYDLDDGSVEFLS